VLIAALEKADDIAAKVSARNREIEAAGFTPQVQDVPGLSLVFNSVSGTRKRVPIKAAKKQVVSEDMGPNVLLRPVVERAILPTAAYIGGPAEIAYFAQISPIAETVGVPRPLILPRWSCTIIEPHIEKTLETLHLVPEDFRDPHGVEARVARAKLPTRVIDELTATRELLDKQLDRLSDAVTEERAPLSPAVTGGLRANLLRRLERFERRLIAAAKKQHARLRVRSHAEELLIVARLGAEIGELASRGQQAADRRRQVIECYLDLRRPHPLVRRYQSLRQELPLGIIDE
jgi:hypothetical protein